MVADGRVEAKRLKRKSPLITAVRPTLCEAGFDYRLSESWTYTTQSRHGEAENLQSQFSFDKTTHGRNLTHHSNLKSFTSGNAILMVCRILSNGSKRRTTKVIKLVSGYHGKLKLMKFLFTSFFTDTKILAKCMGSGVALETICLKSLQ